MTKKKDTLCAFSLQHHLTEGTLFGPAVLVPLPFQTPMINVLFSKYA